MMTDAMNKISGERGFVRKISAVKRIDVKNEEKKVEEETTVIIVFMTPLVKKNSSPNKRDIIAIIMEQIERVLPSSTQPDIPEMTVKNVVPKIVEKLNIGNQ